MTDTGGFRHNNTRQKEFQIATALVGYGADPHKIALQIYDTNSLERLRLTGFVLSQKLVVLPEYRTAYMTLSQDEIETATVCKQAIQKALSIMVFLLKAWSWQL
ncbi:MAG: hypothetical protein U5K54_10560 [Cytophagales bacterium]|nr:hypothetical protein [Cytophagales bacterium]